MRAIARLGQRRLVQPRERGSQRRKGRKWIEFKRLRITGNAATPPASARNRPSGRGKVMGEVFFALPDHSMIGVSGSWHRDLYRLGDDSHPQGVRPTTAAGHQHMPHGCHRHLSPSAAPDVGFWTKRGHLRAGFPDIKKASIGQLTTDASMRFPSGRGAR